MIITQINERKTHFTNDKNCKVDRCLTNYLLHDTEEGLHIGGLKFSLKSLEEIYILI